MFFTLYYAFVVCALLTYTCLCYIAIILWYSAVHKVPSYLPAKYVNYHYTFVLCDILILKIMQISDALAFEDPCS